jgi:spermidine/putrescine-binding protein
MSEISRLSAQSAPWTWFVLQKSLGMGDAIMERLKLFDRIAQGKASRRDITKALGLAGLAAVTSPLLPRTARAGDELTYFTWNGYNIPEFHPGYIEKHGSSPNMVVFGEDEEALTRARAGFKADLAHPCKVTLGRWRDAGLIEPFDMSRISAWDNIWDELKNADGVTTDASNPHGAGTWYIPWEWGNASVAYRTDLAPEYKDNPTWTILWDEKYKGRLSQFDSVDGAVLVAALVAGAKDPFHMTDEELAQCKVLLSKQRELLRFWWNDQSTVEQSLASGEVVAAYTWNDAVVRLKKGGTPIDYMNPKEGIFTWFCGLVKCKDGPGDVNAAYDLVNAMLEPRVGKYLIENFGYGHSNRKSFELVDEATLEGLGIRQPQDLFKSGIFFAEMDNDVRQKYIAMFEQVKAGG